MFLKLNANTADSTKLSQKEELDEKIATTLRKKGVGDQAADDEQSETDLHFVLPKNYDKALQVMLSVIKDYGYQDRVTFWRRDYDSLGRWSDQMIMRK